METEEWRLQSERLPTLFEVLNNQTAAPVDSWSFYTFLFQYPGALNYMDFWVDVMAHLRLCKDYVKGIRESMMQLEVEEQQGRSRGRAAGSTEKRQSLSSSVLLDALLNDGYLDYHDNRRISQFLKGDGESARLSQLFEGRAGDSSGEKAPAEEPHLSLMLDEFLVRQMKESQRPKLTTKQLIASANAIVDRYLVSKDSMRSERLLTTVPEHMRLEVINLVKGEQRYDPDVFEPLKIISFQFLEIYCFPKFLSSVALHNLHYDISLSQKASRSPYSQCTTLARVATGFFFWAVGFWVGYSLILLDYPRRVRTVTLVPFLIGSYYIVCGIYHLDIIYAACGVTQTLISPRRYEEPELGLDQKQNSATKVPFFFTFLGGRKRLTKVRHPFVLNIMRKRALWCLFLVLAATAVLTVIFTAVPSVRL
ncbi:AaceriAFR532Wp [[Ashbya] aceris (nom. inval.)]|nr:AaceriAFR532Wp [[Ashbya] aceris (nom. inval.)]